MLELVIKLIHLMKNNMKKIIFLLALILICSCTTKNSNLKGDLYFKLIGFSNGSELNDEQVIKIEKYLDSISDKNIPEDKTTKYFKLLRNNNLLHSPSILIKTTENTIHKVFLSELEYEKVKPYTLEILRKKGKKLQLEINAKELDSNLYFCDKIISIKEVDGMTPYAK